jgi:hypothetical protein
MQSIREQIIQAVVARLTPVAAAQGATIQRQPTVPADRARMPALLVFPESESVQRTNTRSDRVLVLRVVALASGSVNEPPEPIADRLLAEAHAALFTDINFGGLALGLEETGCDWQQEDADMEVAAMPARYSITYRTYANNITLKG